MSKPVNPCSKRFTWRECFGTLEPADMWPGDTVQNTHTGAVFRLNGDATFTLVTEEDRKVG
jgi:hypothetical protein